MKKIICCFLSALMLCCSLCVFSYAEAAVLESSHPYKNNTDETFSYTCGEPADFLSVTFSPDTAVENRYDRLYIYGGDGEETGKYTGKELAGKTLLIAGQSFSVRLVTDSSVDGYGFCVTDVRPVSRDELCLVTLNTELDGEEPFSMYVPKSSDKNISIPFDSPVTYGKAFAGWSEQPQGDLVLSDLSDIGDVICGRDSVTLYAKWITPLLASDEIYQFSNSSYYFDVNKDDEEGAKYYMNDKDRRMMVKNLYRTYAVSPVSVIGSIVFSYYPEWEFRGSCYGMSATAAMQHYGYIDMLRYGDGAEKLIELEPTEELISAVNYYQYGAMVSFLCENVVLKDCPKAAAKQFRNLTETVESGKIVMFTYYDGQLFVSSGHTVLLTGAYTDENGNHVLILYDNRYPSDYQNDFSSRIIISPDYSKIRFLSRGKYEEEVGAFNWTADFTAFETININGGGKVLSWYKALLNHIFRPFAK